MKTPPRKPSAVSFVVPWPVPVLLAEQDKFQFQWWVLGLVGARSVEQKQGADHGIDGTILFPDDLKAAQPEQIIIQVKGGKAGVDHVRDLRFVSEGEHAAMGLLVTLHPALITMPLNRATCHGSSRPPIPRLPCLGRRPGGKTQAGRPHPAKETKESAYVPPALA